MLSLECSICASHSELGEQFGLAVFTTAIAAAAFECTGLDLVACSNLAVQVN